MKREDNRVWIDDDVDGYVDAAPGGKVPDWLERSIGPRGGAWKYTEDAEGNRFDFSKEDDAVLFQLTWEGRISDLPNE